MSTRRKVIVGVVVLAVCGLAVTGYTRLNRQPGLAMAEGPALPVKRGMIATAIDATGNVSARQEVALAFEITGRVSEVYVSEGDEVAAGQPLVVLDTTDLETDVAQARLSVAINEAQLAKLRAGPTSAELGAARANLESARENLAKVEEGPTEAQLAASVAALRAAQDSYQQVLDGPDNDEILIMKADMDRAQVALRQAQTEYDKYAWMKGYEASPQAAALHQATIDYERAAASYRLKVQDPTAAELQNAVAQLQRAQDDLDRVRDSPTEAEMAAAEAQVAQAESQLDALQRGATDEDIAIAEVQVEQARVAAQQSERRLQKAQLLASFSGTVTAVNYDVGDLVNVSLPAISLADLSTYEIEVFVDEVDIAGISPGQRAEITLESYRDVPLMGTVRRVAPKGIVTQGVVNFPVTVDLSSEDLPGADLLTGAGIRLEMTANVRIIQEERQGVLLVPLDAIRREGATEYVVVPDPSGELRRVHVVTGQLEEDVVEVHGDIQEGDQVLLPQETERRSGFGPFGGP
jgi:HlyD family secretion protein